MIVGIIQINYYKKAIKEIESIQNSLKLKIINHVDFNQMSVKTVAERSNYTAISIGKLSDLNNRKV